MLFYFLALFYVYIGRLRCTINEPGLLPHWMYPQTTGSSLFVLETVGGIIQWSFDIVVVMVVFVVVYYYCKSIDGNRLIIGVNWRCGWLRCCLCLFCGKTLQKYVRIYCLTVTCLEYLKLRMAEIKSTCLVCPLICRLFSSPLILRLLLSLFLCFFCGTCGLWVLLYLPL